MKSNKFWMFTWNVNHQRLKLQHQLQFIIMESFCTAEANGCRVAALLVFRLLSFRLYFHETIFSSTGPKICWEHQGWLVIQSSWQPGTVFDLSWCFHYGFNEFSRLCCWQMLPQEKSKAMCLSARQHHRHTFFGGHGGSWGWGGFRSYL